MSCLRKQCPATDIHYHTVILPGSQFPHTAHCKYYVACCLPFADDTTAYNRMFRTPNMERLAAQGMKFTQAYACAISSPSRCSLITGANNARHRVTNWTLERDKSTDDSIPGVILPEWNWNGVAQSGGVNNTYIGRSFVDLLRQSGYHTVHVGKAHFGAIDTPGENPAHWGFETNIAGNAGGGLATYLSENNYGHRPDGSPYSLLAIPGLERAPACVRPP